MTGIELLDSVVSDGYDISSIIIDNVAKELDKAIEESRLHYIEKGGDRIGFLECLKKDRKVFVANCYIYKKFRGITSLMTIRNILRKIYNDRDYFYWRSRKRGKICYTR